MGNDSHVHNMNCSSDILGIVSFKMLREQQMKKIVM